MRDGSFRTVLRSKKDSSRRIVAETSISRRLVNTRSGGLQYQGEVRTVWKDADTGKFVSGAVLDALGIKHGKSRIRVDSTQVLDSIYARAEEAEAGHINARQFERLKGTISEGRLANAESFRTNARKMFEKMNPSAGETARFLDAFSKLTPEQAQHWYERNQNLVNSAFEAYHNYFRDDRGVRNDKLIESKRGALIRSLETFEARYL